MTLAKEITADTSGSAGIEGNGDCGGNGFGIDWIGLLIQAALTILVIGASLVVYHYAIVEEKSQRIALVDIAEVIGIKQLEVTERATRPGIDDRERERLFEAVTEFAKQIDVAVSEIQEECGCTLLVRSAVVKTTKAEDLTPMLKARLGLTKSLAELTEAIRSNPGSANGGGSSNVSPTAARP